MYTNGFLLFKHLCPLALLPLFYGDGVVGVDGVHHSDNLFVAPVEDHDAVFVPDDLVEDQWLSSVAPQGAADMRPRGPQHFRPLYLVVKIVHVEVVPLAAEVPEEPCHRAVQVV